MMPLKMILVSPRTKKTALKSTISVSSEFEYLNLPSVTGKPSKGQPTPPARRLVYQSIRALPFYHFSLQAKLSSPPPFQTVEHDQSATSSTAPPKTTICSHIHQL